MKKLFSIFVAAALCATTVFFTTAFAKTKDQEATPKDGDTVAVLHTNYGDIAFNFFADEAPKGVENFQTLAKEGKYNDTIFHRVVDDFMIQGGDYENSDGTGGQSCWGKDFENECVDNLSNIRGSVSYANRGQDTNSSQFFINSVDNSQSLDGSYTVFGQVFAGMDVVDLISDCEVTTNNSGENSSPVNPVKLESVDITEYSSDLESKLDQATDPYANSSDNSDDDTQVTTTESGNEGSEFTFSDLIPIFITIGVIAVIFAAFAVPYAISDKKKKKAKAEAKARMKADPDYKKKKSNKKSKKKR
ncbi:MAG: peptidylprolyl isomerase [Ruminococcus sp.]|nr:peptidylprolyl isomerase [Ruminococcus sp.]